MLGMVHRQKQRKKSCIDIRRTMRGFTRMRDAEREEGICNLIKMQFCTNEQKANNTDRSQQCWSLLSRCTITALVLLRAWSQGPHAKDDITWTTFLCRSKKRNLRGMWAGASASHEPLGENFMTSNSVQWKSDKSQASALWTDTFYNQFLFANTQNLSLLTLFQLGTL